MRRWWRRSWQQLNSLNLEFMSQTMLRLNLWRGLNKTKFYHNVWFMLRGFTVFLTTFVLLVTWIIPRGQTLDIESLSKQQIRNSDCTLESSDKSICSSSRVPVESQRTSGESPENSSDDADSLAKDLDWFLKNHEFEINLSQAGYINLEMVLFSSAFLSTLERPPRGTRLVWK